MSNMFDDARNRLKEKNSAVKVRSAANDYSSENMFDAARKRLKEKQGRQTQNSMATANSKVEIPQATPAGSASVADLLPKPTTESGGINIDALKEKLKKSSYGETDARPLDQNKVSHSSGNFVNVEDMNPLQRVWNSVRKTISGGLKSSLGSNVNTQGVAYQAGQKTRDAYYNDAMDQYQKELDAAVQRQNYMKRHISDGKFTQEDVDAEQNYIDYYNMMLGAYGTGIEAQKGATQATYKLADKVSKHAANDIQSAKDTSYGGKFGEMLVDAGASTVQSSADALASMLLTGYNPLQGITSGAPVAEVLKSNAANAKHTMAPFVIRAFGGGAQKARQEMEANGTANDENAFAKQVAYGVADAAKEWVTEKLDGIGAGGVYAGDGGFLDEFWDTVGDSFAENITKSAMGRKIISDLTSSFLGEGAEEAIGDYLEYIFSLSDIYGGADESLIKDWKAGEGLGEKAKNVAKGLANKFYDASEDFIVGGLSGVMGGAVESVNEIAGTAAIGKDLRSMGAGTQPFIDTGMESLPGTESRELARMLQQKQDAGKNINNYELGALYNANVEAVSNEEKARQALIAEDAKRYTIPSAEDTTGKADSSTEKNNDIGNIVLPTAAENGVMPTYVQNTELSEIRKQAEETGTVTNSMAERVMQNQNAMQELGIDWNGKTKSQIRAEVKQAILDNGADRGIINTSNAIETNNDAVEEGTVNGGREESIRLRGSTERDAGQSTERQAQGMEGSAGGTLEGRRTESRSRAAQETGVSDEVTSQVSAAAEANRLLQSGESADTVLQKTGIIRQSDGTLVTSDGNRIGKAVPTAGLGIYGGSNTDSVILVDENTPLSDKQRSDVRKAETAAKKFGVKIKTFAGNNITVDGDEARGYFDGDTIYVRADHGRFSAYQIARHELGHYLLSRGVINTSDIKAKIEEMGISEVANLYLTLYSGTGLSEEEIWDEIVCDALGELNVFSGTTVAKDTEKLLSSVRSTAFGSMTEENLAKADGAFTERKNESRASREIDANNIVKANTYSDEVRSSMSMEQAKQMVQRAFALAGIKEYYEGEYTDGYDWLKKAGPDEVAMYVENEYTLQEKYLNKIPAYIDGDISVEEILAAYLDGQLTGTVTKAQAKRLDTSRSTGYSDSRFYAPKSTSTENAKELYDTANQKITKSNKAIVTEARAKILFLAHDANAAESIGISNAELNKKLRTWGAYPAKAIDITNRINRGVAPENRWTGIQNCSILNKQTVSDEDILQMVKGIEGTSDEYKRAYIGRTMLALDTHINWGNLTFEFKSGGFEHSRSTRGMYSKDKISVANSGYANTVAHEMGHALDSIWGRELFGKTGSGDLFLSDTVMRPDLIQNEDARQFYYNFRSFIDSITDSSDIRSSYTQDAKEVFARFVAKFVEFSDATAGNRFYQESSTYSDRFTANQYIEFARLLQEKAMLDASGAVKPFNVSDNGNVIPLSERFNSESSDIRFSREESEDLNALVRENERLKKQVEYWRQQTKATTEWKADAKQEAENAKSILKSVSSKANADDVTKRITKLHEDMSNGRLTYEDGKAEAVNIAADIVNKSSAMVSKDVESYNEAKRIFHSTAQTDVAYKQLQQMFGEDMFPRAITTREMLENINEYFDLVKPIAENPYDLDKALIIEDVANDIVDSGMEIQQAKPTVIDKERAKAAEAKDKAKRSAEEQRLVDAMYYGRLLAEERAKHKEALAKERGRTAEVKAQAKADAKQQREISKAELEVQKQTDDMYYGRKLEQIRRQRDAKIDSILQHQREVVKNRREARQEASDRNRLLKIVKRLSKKSVDPVTKAQIPDIVKQLDTVAVNITDKSIEKLADLRAWYDSKFDQNSDNYDPNFIPDNATKKKLQRLEAAMNGRTIGQMSISEVRDLTEILQNIEHNMNEARKYQESKLKIDNYEAGIRVINDIGNAAPGKINRELDPRRAARRIAGYNDGAIEGTEASPLITLVDECVEGERKADMYQRDVLSTFKKWLDDGDFMRSLYGKKAKEIMITGVDARTGETRNVAITPAMRISLFLHSMSDDNMRHIQEGGVQIPAMNLYKKGKNSEAYAADIRLKLTKTNVARICEGMSAEEKAFAAAAWRYFNVFAPKRLNEASVKIDGYEKFNVENYFPISVDSNFLAKDYENLIVEDNGSLTHPGFGEERIQSSKPIYLRDINDVLMNAVRTNASYACKAIPLMNLSKLINVEQNGAADSVKAALGRMSLQNVDESKYKEKGLKGVSVPAYDYLKKFMQDYAGNSGGKQEPGEKLLTKLRSNYSGAVLTLAGGTAIKQAASYPTAAAVVSPGSLLRAMDKTRTVDTSFIDERTAVFTKRTEGYSTVELAEMQQEGKRIPKALNWIQMVDVGTTKLLKRAAAIEVQKTTNLKIGTEEYKQAVTDMYIDIIEKTQPNYSTALRPDILRSNSAGERALVMFATQPMQNFGILYDAFGDYRAKKNAHDATKSKATDAALNAARKKLGRAVGSQIASSLVFSLMQYAYDWFRRKDDKYRDDDGNLTFGSFSKAIGLNMLTNGAGMFIAGKVALEFTETAADKIVKSLGGDAIFNASSYGFEVAELSAISDAATNVINAAAALAKTVNDSIDGEEVNIESAARKTWKAAEDSLVLFGIPLKNATTMLTSAAKQVLIPSLGKYIGGYYALRISANPEDSKKPFYDLVWDSIRNGTKTDEQELIDTMLEDGFDRKKIQDDINGRYYDKIWENRNNRSEMMRWYREAISHGTEPDNIKSSMESRMKKEEGVDSVKDLKKRWDDIIG